MAKIVNIILRQDMNNNWIFGVVRDDTYQEVQATSVESIKDQIASLVAFADTIKTKEQLDLEEANKRQEAALNVIYQKTTLDERLKMINILRRWKVDETVKKGDERTYNDILFIAKKDHVCSYESIPINDKSSWKRAIAAAELPDIYNHEKKYKINEKCVYNGHVYSSLIVQEGQSPFASPKTWEDEGEV